MIVCSCNVLSDRQIREALVKAPAPVRTVGQVYRCLGCRPRCGGCARTMRVLLERTVTGEGYGASDDLPAPGTGPITISD